MHIDYHPSPAQFQGKGTVYIFWDDDRLVYDGYWDLVPDGPPTAFEQLPSTASIVDALRWGRERTDFVVIRPEFAPDASYWGGTGTRPARAKDLLTLPDIGD